MATTYRYRSLLKSNHINIVFYGTLTFGLILINSVSGIIGHLTKATVLNEIQSYWFLLLTVLIGGQVGNFLNLKVFPARILALITSSLVLFVALRMGYKIFI